MHDIRTCSYPSEMSKKEITADVNSIIRHCGRQQKELYSPIRWYDSANVLDSEDDAEEFLMEHGHTGYYDSLAIRYREVPQDVSSKKLEELCKKADEARINYEKLNEVIHFKDAKSEFISCRGCGSKLNRKMLIKHAFPNECPLCHTDLRPESTLKRINAAKEKKDRLFGECAEERKKIAKKNGRVCWLVRFEFNDD